MKSSSTLSPPSEEENPWKNWKSSSSPYFFTYSLPPSFSLSKTVSQKTSQKHDFSYLGVARVICWKAYSSGRSAVFRFQGNLLSPYV